MSFLDNVENAVKAEEARAQRDPEQARRDEAARRAEADAARAAAPYVEALRNGPFTQALLTHARAIGHRQRTLVRFAWVGDTLRLEAKEKRADLAATGDGVVARYFEAGEERGSEAVDLSGDAEAFARRWLES